MAPDDREQETSEADVALLEGPPQAAQICHWLVVYVAALIEFEPSEVLPNVPLGRYGLDSLTAPAMMEDLGQWMGRKVDPALLYKLKTIDEVSAYIAENFASLPPLRRP